MLEVIHSFNLCYTISGTAKFCTCDSIGAGYDLMTLGWHLDRRDLRYLWNGCMVSYKDIV